MRNLIPSKAPGAVQAARQSPAAVTHGRPRRWRPSRSGAGLAALVALLLAGPALAAPASAVLEVLERDGRQRLLPAGPAEVSAAVQEVYAAREGAPLWLDARGVPRATPIAELLRALCDAPSHGLSASAYPVDRIREALARTRRGEASGVERAELDVLLSHSLLLHAWHLRRGRVPPEDVLWHIEPPALDLSSLLQDAARGRVGELLERAAPSHQHYARLRGALARLRQLQAAGGWPEVAPGALLSVGDEDPRLRTLRERLELDGDLPPDASAEPARFDAALEDALKRFQRRHGLRDDGILGPNTLAALNVPVEERIAQVELNLERLRWLPLSRQPRSVLVNIPGYWLEAREEGQVRVRSPVIVGEEGWNTPVFQDVIERAVVHPEWYVPRSIAEDELLGLMRQDATFARRNGFRVLRRSDGQEVDPESVRWATATTDDYLFVQRSDEDNPLGRAKLQMRNPYNVYLHGTPAREALELRKRALSHGCVRVKELDALGRFLFTGAREEAWRDALARQPGSPQVIELKSEVPVFLAYLTTWADEEGQLHTRPDVYGRDARLREALGPGGGGWSAVASCG